MEELGRQMLKHCGGLPLATVVLGGLLSREPTVYNWETMLRNVKACINRGKMNVQEDSAECSGVSWVLGLSYDELPHHLRPCFLFLAHYPEDYEIHVKELCYMWVVEGFVSPGETMKDLAYSCLLELVQRSMLQVGKLDSINGRIKTCRMHDFIRDLCIMRAQEENFMRVINSQNRDEVVDSLSSTTLEHVGLTFKNRRLSMNSKTGSENELLVSSKNLGGYLRAFLCFCEVRNTAKLFGYFQVLRVLKIEVQSASDLSLPREIGELIHLRLLSLKNTRASKISFSLRNLRYLQMLDLRLHFLENNFEMPNMTGKSGQLKHLYCFNLRPEDAEGPSKLHLSSLKSLRTLMNIPTTFIDSNHWAQLTNLTKLGMLGDFGQNLKDIFKHQGIIFDHLQSLTIAIRLNTASDRARRDIKPIIKRCPHIYKLRLDLPIIKLPDLCKFSRNLIKLTMRRTSFEDDAISILEKLPNLRILCLDTEAFKGNEIVCSRGGFPQLESLPILRQVYLKECI